MPLLPVQMQRILHLESHLGVCIDRGNVAKLVHLILNLRLTWSLIDYALDKPIIVVHTLDLFGRHDLAKVGIHGLDLFANTAFVRAQIDESSDLSANIFCIVAKLLLSNLYIAQ